MVAAPRIYVRAPQSPWHADRDQRNYFKDPSDDQWIRTTDFTPCYGIRQSSAFCLELPFECTLPDIAEIFYYFNEFDGDLNLETGRSYSHNLDIVPIVQLGPRVKVPYTILFMINHMV